MTENKWQTHNIGFAKWRVQCFYDSLGKVQVQFFK